MTKPRREPTGWIRRVLRLANDAAEGLYELDVDMHEHDGIDCSWCRTRLGIRRAAKMAKRQLQTIQVNALRRELQRTGRFPRRRRS